MEKSQLYYGDNLDVMQKFIRDESVDLCYIDPPFNSKRNYNQIYNNIGKEDKAQSIAFMDTWVWDTAAEHGLNTIKANERRLFSPQTIYLITGLQKVLGNSSLLAYLISMTLRIAEIHRVLKPTGSFYLHCDPTASHYLKLVLDSIFCSGKGDFINEIIWCYKSGGMSRNYFQKKHDVIFFYTKSSEYKFNGDSIRIPYDETSGYAKSGIKAKSGKVYMPNEKGKIPEDWWYINFINPLSKERLGYPTQKPEELLDRIIRSSSDENDVVLDAYCGCGTTVAVAQKLKRRWIGIDITYQSISLILKRLEDTYGRDVLDTITMSGVPVDIESANALALKEDDRVRKEFEKWAVLTYSNNRAMINEKKGSDGGIDGRAFVMESSDQFKEVLFSVKSGKVNSGMIRDLRGVLDRENAAAGIFITLLPPTSEMLREAISAGFYNNPISAKPIPKIKIVTIEQILAGERLDIPMASDVIKKARAIDVGEQQNLF